ncbi:uncharacterized protein [Clytia hemisphaerica]|uniref:Cnidarian restricted protein n=1 Tax=Clytia hemisphaerica TaxID=252671 RepID=A0A7M5VG27_9CNID
MYKALVVISALLICLNADKITIDRQKTTKVGSTRFWRVNDLFENPWSDERFCVQLNGECFDQECHQCQCNERPGESKMFISYKYGCMDNAKAMTTLSPGKPCWPPNTNTVGDVILHPGFSPKTEKCVYFTHVDQYVNPYSNCQFDKVLLYDQGSSTFVEDNAFEQRYDLEFGHLQHTANGIFEYCVKCTSGNKCDFGSWNGQIVKVLFTCQNLNNDDDHCLLFHRSGRLDVDKSVAPTLPPTLPPVTKETSTTTTKAPIKPTHEATTSPTTTNSTMDGKNSGITKETSSEDSSTTTIIIIVIVVLLLVVVIVIIVFVVRRRRQRKQLHGHLVNADSRDLQMEDVASPSRRSEKRENDYTSVATNYASPKDLGQSSENLYYQPSNEDPKVSFKNKQAPSRQRSQNHYEPTTVDLTKPTDISEEAEYEDPNAGHLYQAIPANATFEREGGYTKIVKKEPWENSQPAPGRMKGRPAARPPLGYDQVGGVDNDGEKYEEVGNVLR